MNLNNHFVLSKHGLSQHFSVHYMSQNLSHMMMSWHGNAFHLTGSLWRESTGNEWFPSQCRALMYSLLLSWTRNKLLNKRVGLLLSEMPWHACTEMDLMLCLSQHFSAHTQYNISEVLCQKWVSKTGKIITSHRYTRVTLYTAGQLAHSPAT